MGLSGVGAGLSLIARMGAIVGCSLALAHCGGPVSSKIDPKYGVSASPRVVQFGEPVPKGGGTYRVGKPYVVGGRTYSPEENAGYSAEGIASWYGDDFHGRRTANGEVYDMQSISAAHPTLPIPSYARVTNLANQRSIIVRVNDRGPYHAGRLIDVSVRTARLLGFQENGTARVRVDYVGRASLAGSDDTRLEATLRRGTPAPGPAEIKLAASQAFAVQSDSSAVRGAVPTPAERPFELGHDQARQAAQPCARMRKRLRRSSVPRSDRLLNMPGRRPRRRGRLRPAIDRTSTPGLRRPKPAQVSAVPAVPGRAEPVSAYAAPVANPSQGSVVTGRGLY